MAVHPAVLAAAFCLALPVAAFAAGADSQRGACAADATRLCGADVSSVARTTACLVAHRGQLSPTCRGVFVSAEPAAYDTPVRDDHPRSVPVAAPGHPARPHLARPHLPYRNDWRRHVARRAIPYHIPRFDQAQAEAEVHTQYRYRTPYLPYWVFP